MHHNLSLRIRISSPSLDPQHHAVYLNRGGSCCKTRVAGNIGICEIGEDLHLTELGRFTLRLCGKATSYIIGARGAATPANVRTGEKLLALPSRHNRTVTVLDIADVPGPKLLREYARFGHPGAYAFWHKRVIGSGRTRLSLPANNRDEDGAA